MRIRQQFQFRRDVSSVTMDHEDSTTSRVQDIQHLRCLVYLLQHVKGRSGCSKSSQISPTFTPSFPNPSSTTQSPFCRDSMPKSTDLPTKPPPTPRQHRHQPYPSPQPESSQQAHPSFSNVHRIYDGSAAPSPLTQNLQLYSPPTPDFQPYLPPSPQQYQPIQQPRPSPLPRIITNLPLQAPATTNFPPPANFTFRCPNPAYPQFTLSSRELAQAIPEFIAELLAKDRANGITPGAGSHSHDGRRTGGPVEQEHGQNKGDGPKVGKPRRRSSPDPHTSQGHDQRKGGVKAVGKKDGKRPRKSVSTDGGKGIPGIIVWKPIPRSPPVKPKKEHIVTKDGGDDKDPRGTPEPAEIEGDGINEPIDSPFKGIKERPNETLVPESPTSSVRLPLLTQHNYCLPVLTEANETSQTADQRWLAAQADLLEPLSDFDDCP